MADLPYRVDEGVKRAKAGWFLGLPTIRATLFDAKMHVVRHFDVPLAGLLSRKSVIERITREQDDHWISIFNGMRRDPAAFPRIEVVRASRGTPIELVSFDMGLGP